MNSRLNTILGTLSLGDRLIDENYEITKDFLFNIDFEKSHRILEEKRKNDKEFLLNSIEHKRRRNV